MFEAWLLERESQRDQLVTMKPFFSTPLAEAQAEQGQSHKSLSYTIVCKKPLLTLMITMTNY